MAALMQKIAEALRLTRLEKRWQKVARALAIVVVFCTTYALILPAITMESRTSCGMSEHTHKFSCYLDDEVLICGIPEHTHSTMCFLMPTVTDGNVTDGDVPDDAEDMGFFDRIMLFSTPRSDILYYSELENFLVSATIKDYDGHPVESGGTVYVGQHYTVDLEFCEINSGGTWSQFAYDENGYLTYSLPSNLNFDHFGANEWRDINFTDPNTGTVRKVGTYHIYDDGTLKVKFDTESNGVNFIDNYTNVDFHVNFSATVGNSQSGNKTEINFGNDIMVDLNVDGSAAMNVTKSHGSYDGKNNTLDYQIRIEATKAVIKDLVVPDDIWENHHVIQDTIVVTDLNGNVIDPQPVVSNHPSHNNGAEEGFRISSFPDFAAGEGFLISYKTQLYDDLLSSESVEMWNGLDSYGKDSNGNDIYVWAYDWLRVELENFEKEGNQVTIETADGSKIDVIEWVVRLNKGGADFNGTVIIDTLGDGLSYYQDIPIKVRGINQNGTTGTQEIPWSDVTVNGNTMSFQLPFTNDYKITYYTTFEPLQAGETEKNFTNSARVTVNGEELETNGSGQVVGFSPVVKKTAWGEDGEYVYFNIETNVAAMLKDRGYFYLTDLCAFWNYPEDGQSLYVENIPEDIVITARLESGEVVTFTPYVSGSATENTYLVEAPSIANNGESEYHTFKIYFNTERAQQSASKWIHDENAIINISYKLPFDARTGANWTGVPDGTKTLGDVLLEGERVANEAYFNFMQDFSVTGTTNYEYTPKIIKTSVVNEDGTIDYTVTFNNTVSGSGGNNGYVDGSVDVAWFTDTFDERLEYVPDSLVVTGYSPWQQGLWLAKYKYNGTVDGNTINASSGDLLFYDYNEEADAYGWNGLSGTSTFRNYYRWVNAGGQFVFSYKLKVKDEYLATIEHSKFYFDNTAELTWGTDGTSGPVTDTAEFKTGLLDKHFAQDGSKLDFDIHINRNALDILPGAPTLTIVDTMTHNLSVYWQSIKLLYEDPYGNWIDFDSPESIYDYEVTYDAVANALTFVVPDSLHIRIDYSTLITESGMVSVNNSVKIDGKAEVTDVVDAEFRVNDHGGDASGSVGSLTLLKHSGITGENLPDAVLALYGPVRPDGITAPEGTPATVEGHGKTLYYIATYTTGPDGTALMENQYLVHGNMYALYEVTPPAGYIKPDEPTFFYFYEKGDDETVQTVSTIITVPNYIEGDYLLPETGGMGTQYLYITGGSLMFLSVVFLLGKHKSTRKRRSDFSRA